MATQIPNPEDGDRPEGPMPEIPTPPGPGRGPADPPPNAPVEPDLPPPIGDPNTNEAPVKAPDEPARPITDHPGEQNSG